MKTQNPRLVFVGFVAGFVGACLLVTGCRSTSMSAPGHRNQAPPPEVDSRDVSPHPRVVLLSWDGAADWVIDRFLAEGALPNLAAMAQDGVRAESNRPPFPSKTAPGHATLWTGCWPSVHEVTGNRAPARPFRDHTLLESDDGFLSHALQADPIFLTAALAGKEVAVLSATQQYPPDGYQDRLREGGVAEHHLMSFSGFTHPLAAGTMIGANALRPVGADWVGRLPGASLDGARELQLEVAESRFRGVAFDDPEDPVAGLDTVLLEPAEGGRREGKRVLLKPRAAGAGLDAWSPPMAVVKGGLHGNTLFRLFSLAPDGSELSLYQRSVAALAGAGHPQREQAYGEAYAAFHDDPFRLYSRGGFGIPLMEGGDGDAERRVLELVALDRELLTRGATFVLEDWKPDLLMHYSPMADSAGHTWMGYLHPEAAGHDGELAAALWPFYRQVFQELDAWLGALRGAAPPETIFALVSDHGMIWTHRALFVDRILERAGLIRGEAVPGGKGRRIDLAHSQVMVPAFGSFFLRVNDHRFKGGSVAQEDREEVLAAAAKALLAARDPETGMPVMEKVWRAEEVADLGAGGPGGGDLYFESAAGYYPQRGLGDTASAPIAGPRRRSGEHGFWPGKASMQAIFYAAGPGLRQGVEVGPVRQIDVAPTLAHLLGVPAPNSGQAQGCGAIIEEILTAAGLPEDRPRLFAPADAPAIEPSRP